MTVQDMGCHFDHELFTRTFQRVAGTYIRNRKGHIISLESDKFHARTELTDKVVRNWHHYFIDITDRDVSKLVLVLDEPMETVRRPQVLLMTIQ